MSTTVTQTNSDALLWSPKWDKLVYTSAKGLQAYVTDSVSDEERYFVLAEGVFAGMDWSEQGDYLIAQRDDGRWLVFGFDGLHGQVICEICASSVEWVDDDQLLYVPDAGGLVLVYVRFDHHHEVILAG